MEDALRGLLPWIRRRAAEWHVDPNRIRAVGFAGAMLTLTTALAGQSAKPGSTSSDIYGPVNAMTVPADAPPLFVAVAADDPFFGNGETGINKSWIAAKRPVEFHLYEQGGHGFGMYPKTTTSTGWFEEFVRWLDMHEMLKAGTLTTDTTLATSDVVRTARPAR